MADDLAVSAIVEDKVVEHFPLADYQAKLDAIDNTKHEVLTAPDAPIPIKHDGLIFKMSLEGPPDALGLMVKVRVEISQDAGGAWELFAAFTTTGPCRMPDGTIYYSAGFGKILPKPDNPDRRLRITMIPIKDLRTKVETMTGKVA